MGGSGLFASQRNDIFVISSIVITSSPHLRHPCHGNGTFISERESEAVKMYLNNLFLIVLLISI